MRNAGTQLRPMSAALIPPKGIVFGAIDPAMHADGDKSHKKKPSIMPGRVRATFYQLRVLPLGVVKKKYPKRRKASISPHRQNPAGSGCYGRFPGGECGAFGEEAGIVAGKSQQKQLPETFRTGNGASLSPGATPRQIHPDPHGGRPRTFFPRQSVSGIPLPAIIPNISSGHSVLRGHPLPRHLHFQGGYTKMLH